MANIKRYNPLQNLLISAINYLMVIALAMTLAYWFWVFFKPAPIPAASPAEAPTQTILPSILAGHWFGHTNDTQIVNSQVNLKLVGVFGSSKQQVGFAIFQLPDGKQTHAILNHEIVSGIKLVEIQKESVTISQNGVPSTITLEDKPKLSLSPTASTSQAAKTLPDNALSPPPLPVIRPQATIEPPPEAPQTEENAGAMIQRYIAAQKKH